MGKTSAERAFMRGETGVDGQATVEEQSPDAKEQAQAQEALLRGRTWLGRECLTWLLWKSESSEALLTVEGQPLSAMFNGKITLRAGAGDVTEVQLKGVSAPYSKLVRQALSRGLLVHSAKIQLTWGEQVYDFSLDAEFFDVRTAKLPALLQEEKDDQLTERLELATRASILVDALVTAFVKERTATSWDAKVVPSLKEWMDDA
jgi:hypothetical protein